jgi:hypothetical protein
MDIAGVASLFGPVGQIIGGLATAASFLNNLTYPTPKYGWAAVDLAALSVNLIPVAGGVAAGSMKGGVLGAKIAAKIAKGVKLAKSSKGVKAAVGVGTAAKLAKAAVAANTIREELRNDLPADVAEAVEEVLTKKSEEGAYYVNSALDKILEETEPDSQGSTALLDFKKKLEELQEESRAPASRNKGAAREPVAGSGQPPGEAWEEQLRRQDKTLFENWQRIAGIKPRVL